MKPRSGSASLAAINLVYLIGLGEVVLRRSECFAERLHWPVQTAEDFPDGNQLAVALTLHGLFSHAPQTILAILPIYKITCDAVFSDSARQGDQPRPYVYKFDLWALS